MKRLALIVALSGCPAGSDDPVPSDGDSVELHDPLSMPAEPTLSVAAFASAEECRACHPQHYAQWTTSKHASAMVDPVFRRLVAMRQADFDGKHDQFCTQCHSAIGTRGGECSTGFSFDDLSSVVLEGVTCEACHKVSALERTHNSGHILDPEGPMRATIADPMATPAHDSEHSSLHGTAGFCGGCHDVLEYDGLNLERPYAEYLESAAPGGGKTCQTCHMPTSQGQAAMNGPMREVHDHRFEGVALVEGSAQLDVSALAAGDHVDVVITTTNLIDGHNFPTGSTFNRQAWLHVVAHDQDGQLLYETGMLDENGDLLDHFSEVDPYGDPDLIAYQSGFVDARGQPVILSWRASEHFSTTIPPAFSRTHTLFVPTSSATAEVTVDATLRYRTYRPFLLRAIGLEELVEALEIIDVAVGSTSIAVR